MAVDTLSNALGTTPSSLIRGFGGAGGTKERSDYARQNIGTAFEEGAKAEEEAARTEFGIEQGQIQKQATAERDLANRSREAATQLEAETRPYEQFVAPEIKASDYAKNAGMRLLSALLIGGVAGASGRAQLSAIKEMQDAEDAGQRERFNSAKLKFDEADRARKDNNNMLKDRFERMLNLLSKDRNAALVEAKLIEGQIGNGLIAAQLRAKNYPKAYELFTKAIAAQEAAEAELLKQQTMFQQKKELKMTPSGARMGGSGKSGKIQQLPAQLEKKLDFVGELFVNLNRANQTRKPQYFGIAPSDDIANMIVAGVERDLPVGDIMRSLGSKAPKVTIDTVTWWKNYQSFVAAERNKLFGATLTPREAEDFRKFTISPATAPDVANAYFNNQIKIVRNAIERERRKASARGVTDETITAYLDVPEDDAGPSEQGAPKVATKADVAETARANRLTEAQAKAELRKRGFTIEGE
jgi:hypothetical protein